MLLLIPLLLIAISYPVESQNDLVSPCPRLFVYDKKNSEPGKWYGTITLLSEKNLFGTWIEIILDKPSLELGNWLGEVDVFGNQYLVKNPENNFQAHVPQTFRFYIQYNPNEAPPKLVEFRLNARTFCPEAPVPTPPPVMKLFTSHKSSRHATISQSTTLGGESAKESDNYPINIEILYSRYSQ